MIHVEVRKRMIAARKRGVSVRELQATYGYGKTAIYNLIARERDTGSIEPKLSTRGRKSKLNETELERIQTAIEAKQDITLNELREALNLPVSESRLSRIVREKLGYSFKKRWYTPQSGNGQMSWQNERDG